jgi:hypothetical protein
MKDNKHIQSFNEHQENLNISDVSGEYQNIPPKDIQNAIWGSCFDYKDFDDIIDGKTVRDRIYDCWNRLHYIIKQEPDWIVKWVKEHNPDI